jgi:hypothetical protein
VGSQRRASQLGARCAADDTLRAAARNASIMAAPQQRGPAPSSARRPRAPARPRARPGRQRAAARAQRQVNAAPISDTGGRAARTHTPQPPTLQLRRALARAHRGRRPALALHICRRQDRAGPIGRVGAGGVEGVRRRGVRRALVRAGSLVLARARPARPRPHAGRCVARGAGPGALAGRAARHGGREETRGLGRARARPRPRRGRRRHHHHHLPRTCAPRTRRPISSGTP